MITSELVMPHHLARKAIVYVRQKWPSPSNGPRGFEGPSTPNQVLTHQESRRLQYALKERAVQLGWKPADVITIDSDLGLTATSADHRTGFKDIIARVTLGEVGIILSFESGPSRGHVARLARNGP